MKDISREGYLFTQPDSAFYFAQLQLDFAKEKGQKKHMVSALYIQGISIYLQGDYAKAMGYYTQSLKIAEEIGDEKSIAGSLSVIGNIYFSQGVYIKAIKYYTKALKIEEEIGNKNGIASALNNIGNIYSYQGDYSKGMEYYTQSLKIEEEDIGDKKRIIKTLNNIGGIYYYQGEYGKAMDCYAKNLKIAEEIGYKNGISTSLNNFGILYKDQGNYSKAIEYFTKSLKIKEMLGDKHNIANSLNNLGNIYNEQGNYAKAFKYNKQSLTIAQKIGSVLEIKNASESLWKINKKLGHHKESLEMYELFISTRDSMESKANQKAVIQQEYKYAYEKQAAADSVINAEVQKVKDALLTAEKAENKQYQLEATVQKQQAYFLYGGLGLSLLLGGFIFNRFRVTSKQKGVIEVQKGKVETTLQEVEHQKEIIEEAHKEIIDSIDYAGRIQRSFLATKEILDTNLKDYFVFFKPKDMVSGDFYWADKLSNGAFAIVNADSTGHGVPGAIMSILNISSIERAVENGAVKPSDIFNETRKRIIERLKKDGSAEGGKDGMDASIVCFDFPNNKMTYTAAQNPIWVIRAGELIQIKAEKMPVGKHDNDHIPFEGGEFDLQKGDQVYTLTDGYQDQFGGPKGKKFMIKKMREYVLSISHLSMQQQQEKLNEVFAYWKGELEQVDDVCVIGVKI